MRKTKIVCTIGPASESKENLKKLILAGMNVARLNFSHGDFVEHGERIKNIKEVRQELGKTVAILLDTKGPEIRLGKLKEEPIELVQGDKLVLTTEEILGDRDRMPVSYKQLPQDVRVGSTILIDDGLIGLTVESVDGTEIHCRIVNGGPMKSRKGVNVPGVRINLPGITEKDTADIRFGIEQGVDFIAASFVRKASDVLEIRAILDEVQAHHIHIIAKIENQEGVNNLAEILEVSDGLMVARGDLGVEMPLYRVPVIQKELIRRANRLGKPVITATQMLESMIHNPRPTRAEASDVANAVIDGTHALMLSAETAMGEYPIEAVETMASIAEHTEEHLDYDQLLRESILASANTITDAISQGVAQIAHDLNVAAILCSTTSGSTPQIVSRMRPRMPIIAATANQATYRRLPLIRSVRPLLVPPTNNTDEMLVNTVRGALNAGWIQSGQKVVITLGVPLGTPGSTNLIKVQQV